MKDIQQLLDGTLGPVYCLWWKQPYASLMLHGKIETRTWGMNPKLLPRVVLICSSKKAYSVFEESEISDGLKVQALLGENTDLHIEVNEYCRPTRNWHIKTKWMLLGSNPLPNGYAIGIGILKATAPMQPEDSERAYVKHNPALYSHFYENVIPIEPFPLTGKQGWMKATPDIIAQIKPLSK